MACRHSSQLELRIVLHVPSLEVTIVRNLMSCGYRFPGVVRHTPLCWPAPFVILNPDLRAAVLITDTAANEQVTRHNRGLLSWLQRWSLICSYRTSPSKSEVRAESRQAPQSDLPASRVAEEKLRIPRQQFSGLDRDQNCTTDLCNS